MHVVILGRDNCPYCVRAKDLATQRGLDFKYIDIVKEGFSKEDLEVYTGGPVRTVPQIFVDGNLVGGFTEFFKHLKGV
jgi:glutaredoxin 1